MFIGICGAICAGKHEVARFLVEKHGFRSLRLIPSQASSSIAPPLARTPEPNASDSLSLSEETYFTTAEEMLVFTTQNYDQDFVTTTIPDEATLDMFSQRPFFMLIFVDAPVTVRWMRYKERFAGLVQQPTLSDFLFASDTHMYHQTSGLMPLFSRATLRLINHGNDIAALHADLVKLDLTDKERLRPSWDSYFMQLASLAARRSNCMKRRVGCVLVRAGRVIATGYNGTSKGLKNCADGGCSRCNGTVTSGASLSTCLCLHAEENALLEAGRERVGSGAVLYCDTCPCLTCAIKIVQVGITEVVYNWGYSMDDSTARVMLEGGVKLRQYSPPKYGLINLGSDVTWIKTESGDYLKVPLPVPAAVEVIV